MGVTGTMRKIQAESFTGRKSVDCTVILDTTAMRAKKTTRESTQRGKIRKIELKLYTLIPQRIVMNGTVLAEGRGDRTRGRQSEEVCTATMQHSQKAQSARLADVPTGRQVFGRIVQA
jgi:hypothetical protein